MTLQIGNWDIGGWTNTNERDQYDDRLTFDINVTSSLGDNRIRPGVEFGWQQSWKEPLLTQVNGGMTNFAWVQGRFDNAKALAGRPWKYGAFLLYEETWGISSRSNWPGGLERIEHWIIEGQATFVGIEVLALKPWYIKNKGVWNETWWTTIKTTNNRYDSIITEYSGYHLTQLLKAWHIHMHNLGKKSAFFGPVGIPAGTGPSGMNQVGSSDVFPGNSWSTLLTYDMLVVYQYPTCVSCVYDGVHQRPITASLDVVKQIREKYRYSGQLVWMITSKWPDGLGTTDIAVQQAEFNIVAPYVDIIICTHKADMTTWPGTILNPPRLIQFYTEYYAECLPPQCDFTITQ